jgi:Domain of unknown function (DUF4203)
MLPTTFQVPAGALLIAAGLLACFAGYRLFRLVLTVYGFVLGALFASTLVAPSDTFAMLTALGVGGALGALIMFAGYIVGVALVGGGFGAVLAHALWTAWRGSEPGTIVVLFAWVAGATLATALQRQIVIVATAFFGAQTAVAGTVAALASGAARRPGQDDVWVGHIGIPAVGRSWQFLAWVLLGIAGTIVQYRSGAPRPAKKQ